MERKVWLERVKARVYVWNNYDKILNKQKEKQMLELTKYKIGKAWKY